MLAKYGSNIIKYPSSYQRAAKYNAQLVQPSALKRQREKVMKLQKQNYACVERWYQKRRNRILFVKTSFHDTEKNQNIYKKNQSLRLERKRWNNNLKQLLRQIQNGSIFI